MFTKNVKNIDKFVSKDFSSKVGGAVVSYGGDVAQPDFPRKQR